MCRSKTKFFWLGPLETYRVSPLSRYKRSSILTIGIIGVMIPLYVSAYETWTDPETGIEWKYQIDGDNILICRGTPLKKDGTSSALSEVPDTTILATTQGMVVVPSKIQGKNVSVIGEGAFSGCNLLSSIVIPSSVTTIEGMAFEGCSGLTSVTLPVSVTNIGDGLFMFCSGLSSITIPSSVTNIPTATFYQCSALTSITIPSSVKSIGLMAFGECDALKTICVADGDIQRIRGLLENSGANTSAIDFKIINEKLPDGGPYTETVDGIKWTYIITDGGAIVGGRNFSGTAIGVETGGMIVVPDILGGCTVKGVGYGAFRGCAGVKKIALPQTTEIIRVQAFDGCSSMSEVMIPDSVKSIEHAAFANCTSLVTIAVSDANLNYKVVDGLLLTKDGNTVVACPGGRTHPVIIPAGVTTIMSFAMQGCMRIPSIEFPDELVAIGEGSFQNCNSIRTLQFPDGVRTIGGGVCSGCSELESVHWPDGTSIIKYEAFSGCVSLRDADIPSLVTNIDDQVFQNCRNLTSITIPSEVTKIGQYAFCGCSALSSVLIPSGLTEIEDYAFALCSGLISVTIPDGVKKIGNNAFWGCSGLLAVRIPERVEIVGNSAFCMCSGLRSLFIPGSVVNIGSWAFYGCSDLRMITIPMSVSNISEWAFCRCDDLDIVDFEGAPPDELAKAKINQGAIIRYNVAYEDEWLPVIAECGFTKAIPYVPEPQGTVLFVVPNGEASERTHVYTNATYGLLPEARREGCTFAGWYTSLDGTNRVSAFSAVDPNVTTLFARWVEDGTSLYAQWSANTYSVNFNANGGSGSMTAQPFLYDQVQSLSNNVFTKLGYTFKGWATSPEGDVVYSDGASVSNLTVEAGYAVALFARWEKIIDVETEEIEDWVAYELAPKFKRCDETKSAYRKRFEEKFGEDYEVAFFSETGKIGMDGTRLCVWHDYVAGTDPLDESSQFAVTIAIDQDTGKPTVDWSPNLGATERRYTLHGKTDLQDTEWHVVNGDEEKYRFFKVTVEMP